MPTVDLPARNLQPNSAGAYYVGIDHPDALASTDTASAGYINWLGGALRPPNTVAAFDLFDVPGATVQRIDMVTIAYRASGGDHPNPDLSDPYSSLTYPTLNMRWNGDGTNFAGYRIEPLPIGGYAGEVTTELPAREWKYVIKDWPGQPAGFAGLAPEILVRPGDIAGQDILVHVAYLALRITYTTGVLRQAPLRVVQRGNDGLGMSGGRRAVQGRTIQASNRVSGIR